MIAASGRRTLLRAGAGVGAGLASAAIVLPGRAQDIRKKRSDEFVSPAEMLMRDNAVLARILLIYESAMRRLGQGEDIDPAVLEVSARIVLDFIHRHHEKQEEELVFPRFKTAGRMVELVNVLAVQHAAGRKLTERIIAAAPQARNRQPREAMAPDIQAFVTLYRPHMARKETDVYPTLRHLVTGDEHQEIADEMEKTQRQAFGADGFEKVAKKVHEIEKTIGLGDLDVFTPKG
ncbi:MAG: hemerythrin domain-containing protein [Reyranella sp.]|uniref:hemerythrin domain-containing protein n=1 Tax=Reyranella sp. TaxID=1929291 RepID=UPI003D0E2189